MTTTPTPGDGREKPDPMNDPGMEVYFFCLLWMVAELTPGAILLALFWIINQLTQP